MGERLDLWSLIAGRDMVELINANRPDMSFEEASTKRASGGLRRRRCLWGNGAVLLLPCGRGSRTLYLC